MNLEDNVYNKDVKADEAKFKLWTSAGLMLTYWCPSRCACCYNYSGPIEGAQRGEMSVELALQCWRSLRTLAGDRGKVHLTGGEPFGDYGRLTAILKAAQAERLGGLEKIETNAYWCDDRMLVRDRFEELKSLGVSKLQISTDIYHQQYIPIERVRLGIEVGLEVFGPPAGAAGMQVRWRDFAESPCLVGTMSQQQRASCFQGAMKRRPERLVGRAADTLAGLLPSRGIDTFEGKHCLDSILGGKHVHVDGWANLFIGTCVGIIAGRVGSAGLDGFWRAFDWREHPVLSLLGQNGPLGLLPEAARQGYKILSGYSSKCHLCFELRRFLYPRGVFADYLGPGVCYGTKKQ